MKLVFITQTLDRHDPTLGFVHEWVLALANEVSSLTVIALGTGEYHLPRNVRVVSLGKDKGNGTLAYILILFRELVLRARTYDRVLVHMNPEYLVIFGWWWKLVRTKTLLWYTHKHVDFKLRIAAWFADIIATASPESFRLVSNKIHVVGHGIETPKEKKQMHTFDTPVRLICVGRITKSKGCDVLIRAVKLLADQGVTTTLTFVGSVVTEADHEYRTRLYSLIKELHVEDVVKVEGPLPHRDIPACLIDSDIFVSASETGGLDKAVLEAMAHGLPVVTSNDGLTSTLALFPKLMFEPKSPAACADAIQYIVTLTTAERAVLSDQLSTIVATQHSLPSLMQKLVKLLE